MIASSYVEYKQRSIAILDERLAGTTMVALLRVTKSPKRFMVVTNHGGTQSGMRSENSGRFAFARWCRTLEAR